MTEKTKTIHILEMKHFDRYGFHRHIKSFVERVLSVNSKSPSLFYFNFKILVVEMIKMLF